MEPKQLLLLHINEYWQRRDTQHSPELQEWNLTIKCSLAYQGHSQVFEVGAGSYLSAEITAYSKPN